MTNVYSETGNYGHTKYTVRESKKGYIIEVNSDFEDEFNGSKMLVKFSKLFPKGLNLSEKGSQLIVMRHDSGINLRKGKPNV